MNPPLISKPKQLVSNTLPSETRFSTRFYGAAFLAGALGPLCLVLCCLVRRLR
jgi:hypothetical protein